MDAQVVQYVAFGAVVVGLLALVGAVLAVRSAGRARRELVGLQGEGALSAFVDAAVHEQLRRGLRRVGLVRYDALAEMGGRMSFSLALLDDDANGVVISAINGRTESRCYGKAIMGGVAEQELSPEERVAITRAMAGRPVPTG
ncbi:MAG TPA: DUF4446 family protein [Mycobacteriales bacterium]|nr:DUF4446 family protein [Mycobacteriales bacterium]